MPIEFTYVPAVDATGKPLFETAENWPAAIEASAFRRIVVEHPVGLLASLDLADEALARTSGLEVALTHWAGMVAPVVAAYHLAALNARSGGRLALRMVSGPADEASVAGRIVSHDALWQRTDEYLVLLKRLWLSEKPFDHEGTFYSIRGGYVPAKAPDAASPLIRVSGRSGIALKVAARHADVLELAAGTPGETAQLMQRARNAAAERGRADKLRFALPVTLGEPEARPGEWNPEAVKVGRTAARIASALRPYALAGVREFMFVGPQDLGTVGLIGEEIRGLLERSLPEELGDGHFQPENHVARKRQPAAGRPGL